jgi:hypothetical protein
LIVKPFNRRSSNSRLMKHSSTLLYFSLLTISAVSQTATKAKLAVSNYALLSLNAEVNGETLSKQYRLASAYAVFFLLLITLMV